LGATGGASQMNTDVMLGSGHGRRGPRRLIVAGLVAIVAVGVVVVVATTGGAGAKKPGAGPAGPTTSSTQAQAASTSTTPTTARPKAHKPSPTSTTAPHVTTTTAPRTTTTLPPPTTSTTIKPSTTSTTVPLVSVPDVVGKQWKAAETQLGDDGLYPISGSCLATTKGEANGTVAHQSPAAGTRVHKLTNVVINIAESYCSG